MGNVMVYRADRVIKYRIWRALLLLFLAFPLCAQQDTALEQAEKRYKHAQTYHWLGRAKHSDAEDFLTAQRYAREALEILKELSGTEADKLRVQVIYQLDDLANRYDNNFDNIVNELPLFSLITRNQTTYEYVDDPPVTAVNRALEIGMRALPPARPDLQYYTVVVSSPKEKALEDELRFSLGSDPRFFPRPDEDILQILSPAEFALLYDRNTAAAPLAELSEGWDKKYLLYVEIVENDRIDDVVYYGVFLRLFDADKAEFVQSLYADGFAQDRRAIPRTLLLLFMYLLAFAFALPWIIHLFLSFQPKRERGTVAWYGGVVSALIGMAGSIVILFAASVLAPPPATLMVLWSSWIWFYTLTLLLLVLPLLIAYLAGSRIPGIKDRLANANTLGSIIGGAIFGSGMVLCSAFVIEYGIVAGILPILLLSAIGVLVGLTGGLSLLRFFSHGKSVEIIPGIASFVIATIFMGCIMAAHIVCLVVFVIVAGALYLFTIASSRIRKILELKEQTTISDSTQEQTINLESLIELTNEPTVFVDPYETGTFITDKVRLYLDFYTTHRNPSGGSKSPWFAYHIKGNEGTGKTRVASELAKALVNSYEAIYGNRGKILFGDCDEMNSDGSGVPFEPFAQAFHTLLGAGRFEPPSKRAEKIANGLKSVGLESALGAAGLGILGSMMGLDHSEDEGAAASSSVSEMAYSLSKALIELSHQYQAPVILILDDMHYIDPLSEELFDKLVHNLSVEKASERIVLILTENPDKSHLSNGNGEKRWLALLQEHSDQNTVVLHTIEGGELSNPDRFDDLLIDALLFNKDSAFQLLRNIEQYHPDSIQGILQTVAQLVKLDGAAIDERTKRVYIKQNFNFDLLPPPTSLQELVTAKLSTLTEQQKNIVECAAFVGYEFNAEILADVLGIDRLVLLHELRELENKGILHDEVNQDDVYAFNSGSLAAAIRHQTNVHSVEEVTEVPQVVREYHHRVALSLIKQMERFEETIHSININSLIALARRSYAAGDRMLPQAFDFNSSAAERTAKLGRYTEALTFASQAVDCAGKLRSLQWSEEALKMKALVVEMGTIQLRPEEEIASVVEDAFKHCTYLETEKNQIIWKGRILCRWADYVLTIKNESFSKHARPLKKQLEELLSNRASPPLLKLKMALSLSRITAGIDSLYRHLAKLETLYKELETLKIESERADDYTEREVSRLESEMLEDWGIEQFRTEAYQDALVTLQKAIEVKQTPSVNDIEGIAKLQNYMARSYLHLEQKEKALQLLHTAYESAERVGALQHKIDAALLLGEVTVEMDEARSTQFFLQVLQDAHLIHDRLSEIKALINLMKIASIHSNSEMAEEYENEVRLFLSSADPNVPSALYDELRSYGRRFFTFS